MTLANRQMVYRIRMLVSRCVLDSFMLKSQSLTRDHVLTLIKLMKQDGGVCYRLCRRGSRPLGNRVTSFMKYQEAFSLRHIPAR